MALGASFSLVSVLWGFSGPDAVVLSDTHAPPWLFCPFQREMAAGLRPQNGCLSEMGDIKSNSWAIMSKNALFESLIFKCFFSRPHLSAAAVALPWDGHLFPLSWLHSDCVTRPLHHQQSLGHF